MILVLCIMCVLTVLSLSLLLAAATLGNTVDRNNDDMVCRITADSLADLLMEELTEKTGGEPNDFQISVIQLLREDKELEFCWDMDRRGEAWEFVPVMETGGLEEQPEGCELSVSVYWGDLRTLFRQTQEEILSASEMELLTDRQRFDGSNLYISVNCIKEKSSYTLLREYAVSVQEGDGKTGVWQFEFLAQTAGEHQAKQSH